ncbi:hypothetical protein ACWDE0_28490 [Streptomyces sp. 900105755]
MALPPRGAGPSAPRHRLPAQSGAAVSRANASRNGTVADGSSVTSGSNPSWSGSNPAPTVTLSRTQGWTLG